MAVVKASSSDIDLLARLLRAEAEGEGTQGERRLAERAVKGERIWPSKFSLWYFRPPGDCPQTWYDQPFVGRFKLHCFYQPTGEECENIYNTY